MTKKKTVTPDTPYVRALQRKALALDRIHAELDGTEWDSGTMSVVASHLIGAGYKIRSPEQIEEGDDAE